MIARTIARTKEVSLGAWQTNRDVWDLNAYVIVSVHCAMCMHIDP